MEMFLYILYAVAVRAFLFEIKFVDARTWLAGKHRLFDIFLSCPFCNGFWCGLATYLIFVRIDSLQGVAHWIYFGIATGVISWLQRLYTSQWDYNN